MAQTAVPTADTTLGNWTNGSLGTTDIYTKIDEGTAAPNDLDYIRTPATPASEVYVTKLTSLSDPNSSTDHILTARLRKDTAGGGTINFTVQLRESYVNEGSPGTLIATLTANDVTGDYVNYSHTLTGAEADAITDYAALYIRVVCSQA